MRKRLLGFIQDLIFPVFFTLGFIFAFVFLSIMCS